MIAKLMTVTLLCVAQVGQLQKDRVDRGGGPPRDAEPDANDLGIDLLLYPGMTSTEVWEVIKPTHVRAVGSSMHEYVDQYRTSLADRAIVEVDYVTDNRGVARVAKCQVRSDSGRDWTLYRVPHGEVEGTATSLVEENSNEASIVPTGMTRAEAERWLQATHYYPSLCLVYACVFTYITQRFPDRYVVVTFRRDEVGCLRVQKSELRAPRRIDLDGFIVPGNTLPSGLRSQEVRVARVIRCGLTPTQVGEALKANGWFCLGGSLRWCCYVYDTTMLPDNLVYVWYVRDRRGALRASDVEVSVRDAIGSLVRIRTLVEYSDSPEVSRVLRKGMKPSDVVGLLEVTKSYRIDCQGSWVCYVYYGQRFHGLVVRVFFVLGKSGELQASLWEARPRAWSKQSPD